MPQSPLEDLTPGLDRKAMDILGDTIRYQAVGHAWEDVRAYVDMPEELVPFGGAAVVEQDITVEVLKEDLRAKPGNGVRIEIPAFEGVTFRPINPRSDRSGRHWQFEVRDIRARV